MKFFLIKYRFKSGEQDAWHQEIAKFIAAIENEPDLKGRISYRVLKVKDGADYYHLATAADDDAPKALSQHEFFKRYTEKTKIAGGGEVEVLPLELIGATKLVL